MSVEQEPNNIVHVIHGVYADAVALAGKTVGQARDQLKDRLDIVPDAVAVLDGQEIEETAVLRGGQVLCFVKRAGEMGA
jgi:hypothetical protein